MNLVTIVRFDRPERQPFERVATSLTIAYPDERIREPEARSIFALMAKGQDVTHELLVKAREALTRQRDICDRERDLAYWTTTLSTTDEPITPDTPGGGLVARPYEACRALATARTQQWQDAVDALAVIEMALPVTTPRPLDPSVIG